MPQSMQQPLHHSMQPEYHSMQPLYQSMQPLYRSMQSPTRSMQPLYRSMQPLYHSMQLQYRVNRSHNNLVSYATSPPAIGRGLSLSPALALSQDLAAPVPYGRSFRGC